MRKLAFIVSILIGTFSLNAQDPVVDSLQNLLETSNDSIKINTLIVLARVHLSKNLLQSVDYATQAVELAKSHKALAQESEALTMLGGARYYQGNYDKAKEAWMSCIDVLQERLESVKDSTDKLHIKNGIAQLYNNVGVIYKNNGEYDKAIDYYQKNLKIQEEIGNTLNMARSRANIANVYYFFAIDLDKALDYYQQSLELFKKYAEANKDYPEEAENGKTGMANTYLNIGTVYNERKDAGRAIDNYRKALAIGQELNNKTMVADILSRMGMVYLQGGSYQEALDASLNALKTFHEIGQSKDEASILKNIGNIYFKWGRFNESLDYLNQSLKISKDLHLKKEVYDVYKDKSEVLAALGNFKEALQNYESYVVLKDSSIREENMKQISELETKYETERVERNNVLLNTQNKLQEADIKRQRLIMLSLILLAVVIFGFGSFAYRQYRQKKKANILLEEQNIEIKQQRDQIFQQKQEITDSIHYASRIQKAVLPPENTLEQFADHFILYKPRDIVSGDYYWMTRKDEKTIVMAADCTGHGVPGAFMSMLGISFMNEIVNKTNQTQANEILNQLRENVVHSLHQRGKEGEQQDGMDLALCVIDNDLTKLQFAGAYNPLYLVRNGELLEYKPDKMPIGIYKEQAENFTNNIIDIQKGDCLYMFSDGYVDQFGGPKIKKFMAKNFKDLLISIAHEPMDKQKDILDKTIEEWKAHVEQVDDILVMGLRI